MQVNMEIIKKHWHILESVRTYNSIMSAKVLPMQKMGLQNAKEWLNVANDMKLAIVSEYRDLFGKEISFEDICKECADLEKYIMAPVTYPEETAHRSL